MRRMRCVEHYVFRRITFIFSSYSKVVMAGLGGLAVG